MIESLDSDDEKLKNEAANLLVDIGEPAIKFLVQALKTKEIHVKVILTWILGKIGKQVFEDVVVLLKHKDSFVRQCATMILKKIKDKRAVALLIEVFNKDKNPQVRWAALVALREMGSTNMELLIQAVKDPYWHIRTTAAKFLEATKDPRAIKPLIELLKDKDSSVRSDVLSIWSFSDWLKDERAIEPIITLLKEKSWTTREAAVRTLGNLKNPKAVGPLINLLKDKEWMIREQAAWALKEIKDRKAVEPLIVALKDKIAKVREMVAQALGEIGDQRAILPLKKALIDERNESVKSSIIAALGKLERRKKEVEERSQREQNKTEEIKGSAGSLIINKAENEKIHTVSRYRNNEPISSEEFFKSIRKLFYEKIMPILKDNPGVLQKDLYKEGFDSSIFYWMEKVGFIRREKVGNSFRLFIFDEIPKNEFRKFLLRSWEERTPIPVEVSPDSKERIIKYFGKDTLKKLFEYSGWHYQMWKDYNQQWRNFQDDESNQKKLDWKIIYEKKEESCYLYSRKEDNCYVDSFLAEIGACLKFEINDSLQKIINKYWTPECEAALKKYYSKYGFFSEEAFLRNELEKILGSERLKDFYAELEAKAHTFKIRWCGYMQQYLKSTHIPLSYIQHLKFKWKLKPEMFIKKCVYCRKPFYPFYYPNRFSPYSLYFSQIVNYFPIEKSIKEINFCPEHFPISSYGTFLRDEINNKLSIIKEKMKSLLKELVETLGFIPPQTFHKNLYYLKGLPKEKFDKAVEIISKMPPFKKESPSQPKGYKDIFGSWLQALDAAGVLEGGVRKTKRGYVCIAKDGHECRSIGEKIIDDYLYTHKIPHEKEPFYPGERKYRADWKVGEYFIEFWGLKGEEDYDRKIEEKRKLAQKYAIPLIELTYENLRKLDEKLKNLKS